MNTKRKAKRIKEYEHTITNDRGKYLIKARGNYKVVTDWMRKNITYTKQDLIDFYMDELGKDYKAAFASAIIMLSPRRKSKHGDPRGSASNPWGHIAYNEKLPRKFNPETGKKESQTYRFRFRNLPMENRRHDYYRKKKLEQEKESTMGVERIVVKKVEMV